MDELGTPRMSKPPSTFGMKDKFLDYKMMDYKV